MAVARLFDVVLLAVISVASTSSQGIDQDKAEPGRHQRQGDRQDDIEGGAGAFPVACQRQGLQAEGGDRGVSAEEAGHGEQPRIRLGKQRSIVLREVAENAYYKCAADIDEQ